MKKRESAKLMDAQNLNHLRAVFAALGPFHRAELLHAALSTASGKNTPRPARHGWSGEAQT